MAFYSSDILKQFQVMLREPTATRRYNYSVAASSDCAFKKPGVVVGTHFVLTAEVGLRVFSAESPTNKLYSEDLDLPLFYSLQGKSTVSRKGYRTLNVGKEILSTHYHYTYRQPDFNAICDMLCQKLRLPADTNFSFTEATYRRDGTYHNRIIGVVMKLTKESERLYHIDQMLDLLE